MTGDARWKEMLDEFCALGGIAENVRLGEGRFGRGLFPADPSKPIRICIPESLLLPLKYAGFTDNEFRVAPEAPIGNRERAFLESYERGFSWGVSRDHAENLLRMMSEAPADIRELLRIPFGFDAWLAGPSPEAIQQRFLGSRVIGFKGGTVVMPIIELANYGYATSYRPQEDRLELSGRFEGEMLVRYAVSDPLGIFGLWGFASDAEMFALSLPIRLERKGGSLIVGRDLEKLRNTQPDQRPLFPEVSVSGGHVTLSHMLLGHKNYPRVARGMFYKAMRNSGIQDLEETFDLIEHLNRVQLYRLMELSEAAAQPLGNLLRTVARYQLECASHNVGTREL